MLLDVFLFIFLMFLVGLYSFYVKSNHLLNMLLGLEYMSLIGFFLFFILLFFSEKYMLVYFLTFCVCEGAFGLSILVSMVRSFGNDYLQMMMFLKC